MAITRHRNKLFQGQQTKEFQTYCQEKKNLKVPLGSVLVSFIHGHGEYQGRRINEQIWSWEGDPVRVDYHNIFSSASSFFLCAGEWVCILYKISILST